MDKITEALKKLLPEAEVNEVAAAVTEMLEQAKASLEAEYNEKLEEAYTQFQAELTQAEKIADTGYEEAYAIIGDLKNRLEVQGDEMKAALEEGYEEAYQIIKQKEDKFQKLELEMYEDYDKKLSTMKEYIVDKVDQFLSYKGQEIYEQAKRDVLNDPRMAEHKVTLDKIIDLTSSYLSDDQFAAVSSTKLEEAVKAYEDLKGQLRVMEARNIRLSTENTKLNESVRQAQEAILTEQKKIAAKEKKAGVVTEQKERTEKAQNVTGRGHTTEDAVVISEHATPSNDLDQMLVLSGLKKSQ